MKKKKKNRELIQFGSWSVPRLLLLLLLFKSLHIEDNHTAP